MIHLQGMGLVGAQLAHVFGERGTAFSWSDTDEEFTAWRASTGCVYPTNEDDVKQWKLLMVKYPTLAEHTEEAQWCFVSKNPPEGAKLKVLDHVGPIVISDATTIQMHVQRLVETTRERFESRRRAGPRPRDRVVVTHGSATAHHYVWGWSGLVLLEFDPDLVMPSTRRPAIYMRKGYNLAYLYPQPGSQWYYGGTANVVQRTAQHKPLDEAFDKWTDVVAERTAGVVSVTDLKKGSLQEGWRPRPQLDQHDMVWEDDGVLYVRAQGGSGLRHFPRVLAAITPML